MTSPPGRGHLHAGLLYDSTAELTAAVVPFLAEGLAAGEAVVLACREEHSALLAEALGNDAGIHVLHRETVFTRSPHAVATYRRVVRHHVLAGAVGVRLVGEVPVDHRPEAWPEWHRYEAILNVALAPLPLSSVCAYDTRELTESIRHGVEQAHPALLTPDGHLPNDRYVEPSTVLRGIPATPVSRLEDMPPALQLADLADATRLPELRAQIRATLRGPWWQEQPRSDFATAVGEVVINAFRHGAPPVAVRLWVTPTQLVCTVADHGRGFDDPLAGYRLPADGVPPAGAGLWLVRQTCHTLDVVRVQNEFAVRLTALLPESNSSSAASEPPHTEPATVRADRARATARALARALG